MMSKEVQALVAWIAERLEPEPMSGLMPGGPRWNVSAEDLLDRVAELWGILPHEIGGIVNPIRERMEREGL